MPFQLAASSYAGNFTSPLESTLASQSISRTTPASLCPLSHRLIVAVELLLFVYRSDFSIAGFCTIPPYLLQEVSESWLYLSTESCQCIQLDYMASRLCVVLYFTVTFARACLAAAECPRVEGFNLQCGRSILCPLHSR